MNNDPVNMNYMERLDRILKLEAEVSRMESVIEAAIKWKSGTPFSSDTELADAIETYEKQSK